MRPPFAVHGDAVVSFWSHRFFYTTCWDSTVALRFRRAKPERGGLTETVPWLSMGFVASPICVSGSK